ncbi:MAG: hypothetical protein ACE5KM_01295 [Planctomycetaceae bacterium]
MKLFLIIVTALAADAGGDELEVRPLKDARRVEVVGRLSKSARSSIKVGIVDRKTAQRLLKFSLVDETGRPGPAIFGRYERRGSRLVFSPRFRLTPGGLYRATLVLDANKTRTADYRVPMRAAGERAVVQAVYPGDSTLPANNLKFYLHFSKPMQQGRAIFDRIRLFDDRGKAVGDPWRRVEIWSRDYKRLTLFVHPGRIKTGVNLRVERGPVLEPGRRYRLAIAQDVRDAGGRPLAKPFEKTFRAGQPDRARPLPQNWKLAPPRAGTRDPLRLAFGEPLDRLLIQRMLTVTDAAGRVVRGKIAVGSNARSWSFRPAAIWRNVPHRLTVDKQLEDLAGNTPLRLFDRDLKSKTGTRPRLTLPFRPMK